MFNAFLSFVIFIFVSFLGAYFHEKDIQNACLETGNSSKATWQGALKCEPIKESQ